MWKRAVQIVAAFILVGALGVVRALADPVTVTSGSVVAQMTTGAFTLSGEGFSLTGTTPTGFTSQIFECTPCSAADNLYLSVSSTTGPGQFLTGGAPGEFAGASYPHPYLAGIFNFTSGSVRPGDSMRISPGEFTLRGELLGYASPEAFANGGEPVFIADLSGSGIAYVNFSRVGGLYTSENITYVFGAPTAPTPEPASLLLLATGLAGVAGRRVRRSWSQLPASSGLRKTG